uniref:Wsv011-like protein n=1 Tax=Melicertus latisulcatus majanivirus TaxID=2984277 RepID=A0A9C7BM31_9VIRU|nr:MAG: wsv011-like protein [Melicertus latisulcatus majanivirus]
MAQVEKLRIRFEYESGEKLINNNDNVNFNHLLKEYDNIKNNNDDKLLKNVNICKLLWNPKHIRCLVSTLKEDENLKGEVDRYLTTLLSSISFNCVQVSITLNVIKEKLKLLQDGLIESTFKAIEKAPMSLFINDELQDRIQKRRSSLRNLLAREKIGNEKEHRRLILQNILDIHNLSDFNQNTDLEYSLKFGEPSLQVSRADEHHLNYLFQILRMVYSDSGIGVKEMGHSQVKRTNVVCDIVRNIFNISEKVCDIQWGPNNGNNHVLDQMSPTRRNNTPIHDKNYISIADTHLLYGEPEVVLAYTKLLQLRYTYDEKYNHNFVPPLNFYPIFHKSTPNNTESISFYNTLLAHLIFGYQWHDHNLYKNSPMTHQSNILYTLNHIMSMEDGLVNNSGSSSIVYDIKSMYSEILKKLKFCLYSIHTEIAPKLFSLIYPNTINDKRDVFFLGCVMCNLFIFKLIDLVHISRCNKNNTTRSMCSVTIDSPYYLMSHPHRIHSSKDKSLNTTDNRNSSSQSVDKTIPVIKDVTESYLNNGGQGIRLCIYFDTASSFPISMVSFSPHSNSVTNNHPKMAQFNIAEFRGITSDIIDSVSSVVRRYHASAEAVITDIKEERQILRKAEKLHTFEKELTKSIERLDINALGMRREGEEVLEVVGKDGRNITDEIAALRKNETEMTSFLEQLGVKAPETINEPCALEIAETYPDCKISNIARETRDLEQRLPPEEVDYLKNVEKDSRFNDEEFLKDSLKKSKTANILNNALATKLSNGVVNITGQFGKYLIYGGITYGTLAMLTSSAIHSSRGAHYNVINRFSPSGVKSYKLIKYSCMDKSLGNSENIEHPFETQISQYIENNINELEKGANVENPNTKWQSKTKGYAPICCEDDVRFHGSCGGWAVFSDTSVLSALVSERDLPKGASLTCDQGLSIVGAMSDMAIASATDVSKKIIDGVIDVSTETGDRLIMKILQSQFFIVGLPLIIAGLHGIEKRDIKYFFIVFICLFLILLLVRFFVTRYMNVSTSHVTNEPKKHEKKD